MAADSAERPPPLEDAEPLSARYVFGRVGRYLRPCAGLLAAAAVCTFLTTALTLAVPKFVAHIVDVASGAIEGTPLGRVVFYLLLVCVASAALAFVGLYLFALVGQRVILGLRRDVFSHLLSLSVDFFERRRVGELTSRIASDVGVIQVVASTLVVDAFARLTFLVGGTSLVVAMKPELALALLALLPAIGVINLFFGRIVRRLSTAVQDREAASLTVVEEAFSGVQTVKSFDGEEHEVARYGARLEDTFAWSMRQAVAVGLLRATVRLLFFGGLAVVLLWLGKLIQAGELTTGELVEFMAYALLVGRSFTGLTSLWSRWQRLLGAGRRVFQIFLQDPFVPRDAGGAPFDGRHEEIRFEGVRFAYALHPDREVLHGIGFTARRGDMIALVGESGAGKSTIAALLLRLYDVQGGAITIDGVDLRALDLPALRQAIGVVPQDVFLFGRTMRENIAYGRHDATEDEILSAARAAHALEFIERLPHGLDTQAGDRGVVLSGGERQRLAIARALLKDPSILILDEATSHLDTKSEALVKDALERLMQGRTTFVIAHRLSTIRRATRVLVLHEGRIVEEGTHDELMARGGHYAHLQAITGERQDASASETVV